MIADRVGEIERRLHAALQPVECTLADDSALHAGHAGAASGGGHYRVRIVADAFAGRSRVARHRLVYDALLDLMPAAIHALVIEALTPAEASAVSPPAAG